MNRRQKLALLLSTDLREVLWDLDMADAYLDAVLLGDQLRPSIMVARAEDARAHLTRARRVLRGE